jgi:hypothetical protein
MPLPEDLELARAERELAKWLGRLARHDDPPAAGGDAGRDRPVRQAEIVVACRRAAGHLLRLYAERLDFGAAPGLASGIPSGGDGGAGTEHALRR